MFKSFLFWLKLDKCSKHFLEELSAFLSASPAYVGLFIILYENEK